MTASIIGSLVLFLLQSIVVQAEIRQYSFNIQTKTVTRICHTKEIVTVNGQYPGPTIYAREGDTVLVKVTNHVKYNVSIHWHGIRQLRTGWSDGPAYITQCPIQRGQSFTYNFTITGQRGTLFWHAHILWLRATVHGAIVILPPPRVPYPFKPKPHKEFTLILGEWFNADIEELLKNATNQGVAPNASDAHTINGKPGELFACPVKDTFVMRVQGGRHYLLRIINAALNEEHVFAVAGHTLKVVEIDAVYTKPFDTDAIFIAPGQTTNVILYANKSSGGSFFMAAKSFRDSPIAIDREIATAILQYETHKTLPGNATPKTPLMAELPGANDSGFVHAFSSRLKSLNSAQYPAKVPQKIERHLFFTVGFATEPCPSCQQGVRDLATMNNISFQMPTVSLLQAHFFNISGVFTTDFPDNPPQKFNFTGSPSQGLMAAKGTRLTRLSFNSTVELVLQGTSILTVDTHPMHLHGFSFFVVGTGIGNFDANRDPQNFNLVDPPERNTVSVPTGGWSAIRFRAANPGVWFMHCHLDLHMTWGLTMAFLVDNGPGPQQSLLPPPPDLPQC